jgi:hypothetical protein
MAIVQRSCGSITWRGGPGTCARLSGTSPVGSEQRCVERNNRGAEIRIARRITGQTATGCERVRRDLAVTQRKVSMSAGTRKSDGKRMGAMWSRFRHGRRTRLVFATAFAVGDRRAVVAFQ